MKLAVISDIHSNLYALEAVLEDIKKKSVDMIICTGDLVGYHTRPNEVVRLVIENNILTIKGNHDKDISVKGPIDTKNLSGAELDKGIIFNYAIENTSFETKEYLKKLPEELVLTIENKSIKVIHGSPDSIKEYLYQDSPEAKRAMDNLEEDILLCGHTHSAYFSNYGKKLLINAGSIGKPKKGTPDSEYVILHIEKDRTSVTIEEVSYNVEKIFEEIISSPLPNELGILLKTGGK